MREIIIGAAMGLIGAATAFGIMERDAIGDFAGNLLLPGATTVILADDAPPAVVPGAVHKVRVSTLPMQNGVWGIEKRIAAGDDR